MNLSSILIIKMTAMKYISILTIAILLTISGYSQDKASMILDLKKAKVTFDMAKNKFENDKKLLEEKAISQIEFTKSKNELLSAEVEYQKLMLQLIAQQSYIIVEKAVKYQTTDGNKHVKLTLRSTMEGNQDYLNQFKDHYDLFTPEMKSGKTYNIFVSLNSLEENTIIGSPYEIRIPAIDLGQSAMIDFTLLKDVESLQVLLNYNNKKNEKNVFLEKDAETNFIAVTSSQFSQEVDLGSSATFDLSLERFSTSNDVYKLMVVNLPRQISANFVDTETDARLSQLRFNQGTNLRKLSLKTYLPERDDENVVIDQPITFYALIVSGTSDEMFIQNEGHQFSEKELDAIQGGKVKLELIPRGMGKLEVRATNLYHEATVGEQIQIKFTIKNYGTRRVDNIKVESDNPLNWKSTIEPSLISELNPEEEVQVLMTIALPDDVSVGAQEVKIKTEAFANNRRVETDDKTVRIQVNAKTSILGTIALVVLLIAFIVGVVVFGIKISKR